MFDLLSFKGIQKTTLIDFPGRVACSLFLPKCNFRCPFCYNKQLVLEEETGVSISEEEALSFLDERKGFLDGVCITGGEPLLHEGLESFLEKVKEKGLLAKLDTNGSKPAFLKRLVSKGLVGYVAMDIKACPGNYKRAAGTKVDLNAIKESASFIMEKCREYEFRMTAVPSIHSEKDFLEIGKWLNGAKAFFIQQFNSGVPLLDAGLQGTPSFSVQELEGFAGAMAPFFEAVKIRHL